MWKKSPRVVLTSIFLVSTYEFEIPSYHNDLIVDKGQLTFDAEGNDNPNSPYFSRKLHVPGPWSGITVGRGYDINTNQEQRLSRTWRGLDLISKLPIEYQAVFVYVRRKREHTSSWCKKPSAMPTLLDLLTEQLSTDNTQALASSSLAVYALKTLQMQSDDPNNGILRTTVPFVSAYLEMFHCTHHPVIAKSDLYFTFCSILNALSKRTSK